MPGKILVTGGKGQLARELLNIDPRIDAPSREELDFSEYKNILHYCGKKQFDVVIHAGAVTNKFNELVDREYIQSNIIGTANIVLWAMQAGIRMLYISSDYVYPSERGDYTEESVILPVNRYARSKLGGEMAVQLYDNSLIVRTSFYSSLNFAQACTDQFTSRLTIAEAARAIYDLSLRHDVRGVINLGTPRKRSILDIVRSEFNPDVSPITRADIQISYILPPDSSMDTAKYQRLIHRGGYSADRTSCRVCGSEKLYRYLDLGRTPLANSNVTRQQLSEAEFEEELTLQVCLHCGLSQLTKVVDPDKMFKNYLYVSSTPQTFRDHCEELAKTATAVVSAKPGDLVLDIASNDGCLLSRFRNHGMNILGVDPAENLAAEANASGIRTLCTYWSEPVARDIVSRFGSPKIITATNVVAHVDDVHGFVAAAEACLSPDGVLIIEAPYLCDFINNNEFDTAYHEHLSYLSLHPLAQLMEAHGMRVFDIQYFPELHGGSIRTFSCRKDDYPVRESVREYLRKEDDFGLKQSERYDQFSRSVLENKKTLRSMIQKLRSEGKTVWAYGASAKGNTLMNFFELNREDIPVVIDDNPKKWGYYTPGSHMKIVSIDELPSSRVDYLLLLAWNFEREIRRRCEAVHYAGDFIVPVPEATIISHSQD